MEDDAVGVMGATGGVAVEIEALGPARRRVELRGSLPVGWSGRLASGLAAQRVSIVRGWARDRGGSWDAQLELELPPSSDLTPALVLRLTEPDAAPRRAALSGLELLDHRLVRAGADVVIEIEAADGRGLLDRVLRCFALYGLFPREMELETTDGLVHDVFTLRSMHGGAPEPATVAALASKLRGISLS
ncbi:MAG TPA: hypothetical protein VEB43_15060 [Anaeromyxobacter sp.]|nr:hypothetical protein [Anaeromyxobacter sp.]